MLLYVVLAQKWVAEPDRNDCGKFHMFFMNDKQVKQYFYCQECKIEKKIEFQAPGRSGFLAQCLACRDKPKKKKKSQKATESQLKHMSKYLTRND